jgi:hypothetical protein
MKKVFLMLAIICLFAIGCTKPVDIQCDIDDACITGCVAGTRYNGESFDLIEKVNDDTVKTFEACETFCSVYKDNLPK